MSRRATAREGDTLLIPSERGVPGCYRLQGGTIRFVRA